jgi:hypothetical protein
MPSRTPATSALRRPLRWLATHAVPVAVWSSVVAFVVLTLGPALLGRGVFIGTDVVMQFWPWRDGFAYDPPVNTWIGDTVDSYAPQSHLLAEETRAGNAAWWNPYIIGGTPLGSLPNVALFSPMSWTWLLLPAAYAPVATKLLEIAVAVLGMTLLSRRLGLSASAGALGGLVYAASGFMIAWTNWPHTRVAALIPLAFWAVDRLLVRRRWRDTIPLALVLASMLLLGFPAVIGYAGYAIVFYTVVRLVVARAPVLAWARALALGAAAAVLGVALAAWQLVPFVYEATSTIDFEAREQSVGQHLSWTSAASALVPEMIGDVSTYDTSWWLSQVNPVESFSYLGAAALVLVCAAIAVRPARAHRWVPAYVLGGLLVTVWLVYEGGVVLGLAQELPIFSNNPVGRVRSMVGFFAALAVAYAFHAVTTRTRAARVGAADATEPAARRAGNLPRTAATTARWAVAALVVVGIVSVVVAGLSLVPEEEHDRLQRAALVAGGVALLAAVLVVLALVTARRWAVVAAGVVIPVLVVAQAVPVTEDWWPTSDDDTFYPVTDTHQYLMDHLGHDRYVPVSWTMLAGSSSYYRLRVATGHAFHTPEWQALLEAADEDAMASRTNSAIDFAGMVSPVMDRMGVRYGVVEPNAVLPGSIEASSPVAGEAEFDGPATTAAFTGPTRGVQVILPDGVELGPGGGELRLRVLTEDGDVLTETSQDLLPTSEPYGTWVALAAEDVRGDEHIRLELTVAGADEVTLQTDAQGAWVAAMVRPDPADGLTVVHTGEATVYQRETAAPRIRWASDEVVVPEEDDRLDLIASGDLPTSTVVLEHPEDAQSVPGGATGSIEVLEDSGSVVRARVDADDAGWLVLADGLRTAGWSATLDGVEVALVDADEAMAAVHVPAGTHEVVVRYDPPGLRVGAAMTLGGLVVVAATLLGIGVGFLRRRRTAVSDEAGADVDPDASPAADPGPDAGAETTRAE